MLSALAADCARIADLEAQIFDVDSQQTLAALQLDEMADQERLGSFKYPVLTLPVEIISEIFVHFLPVYPSCPPLAGLLSPILLTQICRKWREIALTTPALWRAITLSGNPFPLNHIIRMLSRSGSCPLSIRMDEDEDDIHEIRASELLAAAVTHCERWEYVQLKFVQSEFPTIQDTLPLLRHLALEFDGFPSNIVVREAPLLRTVVLSCHDPSDVILALPWGGLTSLTLTRLEPDTCAAILQQTSNLVHCELNLYDFDYSPSIPPSAVTLSYLESLACTNLIVGSYDGFLGTIIAPALRSLRVSELFLLPDPIDSLASFISNSGCALQKLRIDKTRSVRKHAYRTAFPTIQKLSFDEEWNSGAESDSESGDVESDSDSD
ncbi:hypothetical protein B0H19DRAFT_109672 [Mycena capillaripes]|nr:hypothetical protein B0H19DRAFT_109672 [Mycena capillaripes]